MTYDEAVDLILEYMDYGGYLDKHGLATALAAQGVAGPPACKVDKFSSRMCEHGTKGCDTQHASTVVYKVCSDGDWLTVTEEQYEAWEGKKKVMMLEAK